MRVFIELQDTRTHAMLIAMPNTSPASQAPEGTADTSDVVETRLWLEEHNWLYALLCNESNVAPTFRIPDLLSACVALVFTRGDAAERIFGFLEIRAEIDELIAVFPYSGVDLAVLVFRQIEIAGNGHIPPREEIPSLSRCENRGCDED